MRGIVADAIFWVAVFFEVMAMLSGLQSWGIQLRPEFDPMLAFYHAHAVPVIAPGSSLFPFGQAYRDAAVLSTVLFFLFFLAQLRSASAPYETDFVPTVAAAPRMAERAIDDALPVTACALGSMIFGPTLLPLLTIPAAIWLGARALWYRPSWFRVSPAYYANLVIVASSVVSAFALSH